jgi:hypothetical protein
VYAPADNAVALTLIEHAAGVVALLLHVVCNQEPPPAVCVVKLKKKLVPVLMIVTVCASGLEPTGIVNCSGDTWANSGVCADAEPVHSIPAIPTAKTPTGMFDKRFTSSSSVLV